MAPHLLAAWLAAFAADAATTHVALNAGGRELVLTQRPLVNDAILAGEGVASAVLLDRLARRHPTLARVLVIAGVSVHAGVAAHNLRAVRR